MMRNMILVLTLKPEELALWVGRHAMVVALNDDETATLCGNIIAVQKFLRLNIRYLFSSREALEQTGADAGHIRAINMQIEWAREADAQMNAAIELLGRAVFIGPNEAKGRVQ